MLGDFAPNDWLKFVIESYGALLIYNNDDNTYEFIYGSIEPTSHSRYIEKNDCIYEISPTGDIIGEITDEDSLKYFYAAKIDGRKLD